jgi:hypothetical protein
VLLGLVAGEDHSVLEREATGLALERSSLGAVADEHADAVFGERGERFDEVRNALLDR